MRHLSLFVFHKFWQLCGQSCRNFPQESLTANLFGKENPEGTFNKSEIEISPKLDKCVLSPTSKTCCQLYKTYKEADVTANGKHIIVRLRVLLMQNCTFLCNLRNIDCYCDRMPYLHVFCCLSKYHMVGKISINVQSHVSLFWEFLFH